MKRKKTKKLQSDGLVEQLSLFAFGGLTETSEALSIPQEEETLIIQGEESVELQIVTPVSPEVAVVNYRYDETHRLIANGAKTKCKNNIEAIRLLKQIEKEHRPATQEEQIVLARYVGWGGLAEALTPNRVGWEKEYQTLTQLLTPDEFKKAQESTLTAFYTNHEIIQSIYQWLERIGFNGGNILEPSMGIGNFFSCLPDSLAQTSKLYGVEIDSLSGRIAKLLYPTAEIRIQPFETTDFEDQFFDLVIGNVPFGNLKVADSRYKRHHFSIHNYFIAKCLDKLRPGGLLVVLTSKFTLDQHMRKVRQYFQDKAHLIGAIRFPNTAFKQTAGTSAVEDLLILQKKEYGKTPDIEFDWLDLSQTQEGIPVNEYFLSHPKHILGRMAFAKYSAYGDEKETTCEPVPGMAWLDQLEEILNYLSQQVTYEEPLPTFDEEQSTIHTIAANTETKNFSYAIMDNQLYFREHSKMYPQNVTGKKLQRMKGLIQIHQALREVIDFQTYHKHEDFVDLTLYESQLNQKMRRLNTVYDSFVAKYDYINAKANRLVFKRDSSYPLLCSLEIESSDEKGVFEKASIFYKPTILHEDEPYMAETAMDAMLISLNIKGELDLTYMTELLENFKDQPVSIQEVLNELGERVYRDPQLAGSQPGSGWVTAEEYLSGNVRDKLDEAKAAASQDSAYERNVMALTEAQPDPIDTHEINFILGSTWIPIEYYQTFMSELLQVPERFQEYIFVTFSKETATYHIEGKKMLDHTVLASQTYGTGRMSAFEILETSLNMRPAEVRDRVEDDEGKVKYVINQSETILAKEKQTMIQLAFEKWLFEESDRANDLTDLYNQLFNSYRLRDYDGSHLTFPGMTSEIKLREHQVNVVAQGIYSPHNLLIAHEVGAGKTYSAIAIAHELKRLGTIHKVLITVPNHLVGQWGKEYLTLYPTANILVATQQDFKKENRQQFISRILTSDYDAIIIGHSSFERINMSKEFQSKALEAEIEAIEQAMEDLRRESNKNNWGVKKLAAFKKKLEVRYETLFNADKKDNFINFEELGVDCLIVDEAHAFKNNFSYTKLSNVAGLSNTRSQRAVDMFMKVQYINQQNNGRGVIFLTGTPVSNSMSELHTMQKTLQPATLDRIGLLAFDCWASTFGKVESSLEIRPEGNSYQLKDRFSKFHNLPELMTIFKQIADIKTEKMLNLPIPRLQTGEMQVITIPITDAQQEIVYSHAERAEAIRNRGVDPEDDNFLKLTSEAKLNSIDPRILDSTIPYDPNTKLCICAQKVAEIYHQTTPDRLTQLIFCDKGTPKTDERFTFYRAMKEELIKLNVPEEDIAFIHDYKTDVQRLALFDQVNDGTIRILIGSTEKMGTGMNVQRRLIALHHLDVPWRPADLTQRNGRILRQGNLNEEVSIFNYITENTFDAYLWQILEQKQRYISQIMTEKSPMRSYEDVDTTQLQYAQFKALAVADDRIKHKMEIENEIHRLTILRSSWQSQRAKLQRRVKESYPAQLANHQERIKRMEEDLKALASYVGQPIELEVNGQVLTDKEAIIHVIKEATKRIGFKMGDETSVGSLFGFKLDIVRRIDGLEFNLRQHHLYSTKVGIRPEYFISRLESIFKRIPELKAKAESALASTHQEIENAKKELAIPFAHESKLEDLRLEKARLDAELGL